MVIIEWQISPLCSKISKLRSKYSGSNVTAAMGGTR